NPARAELTARSTSSAPDSGHSPIRSLRSAGLRFSKYSPVEGSTHSPPMKLRNFSAMIHLHADLIGPPRSPQLERWKSKVARLHGRGKAAGRACRGLPPPPPD